MRKLKNIAVSISVLGLLMSGATAAGAISEEPEPIFDGISQDQIEAAMEVSGWPSSPIIAGETITLTVSVDSTILGSPTLEGSLVGLAYDGEALTYGMLDADGKADLTVRPIALGMLELTPFFAGDSDGHYSFAEADSGSVAVHAAPVSLDFDLDLDLGSESASVNGGGSVTAYVSVRSDCSANAGNEVAEHLCNATYGLPSGTVQLLQAGNIIAEQEVAGSTDEALFVAVGQDLSLDTHFETVFVLHGLVMDIMLGAPEFLEYSAVFLPSNWFGEAGNGPLEAQLLAAPTSVDVYAGADPLENPVHRINAESIPLVAIVDTDSSRAAPLSGSIVFFANGAAISDALPLLEGDAVIFEWMPAAGSGDYAITAEFLPATLNHMGSVSSEYPVTLIVPPVPNPTPEGTNDEKDPKSDNSSESGKEKLADTGSNGMALTGAAALLIASGGALFMLRRRLI